MAALPDPGRSRAVLIGASSYRHFEDLPTVHNNLAGFRDVLINPALGGLSADNCTVVEEPSSSLDIYRVLRMAAAAAEDMLLVYFSGHGRTGDRNELYLCLPDTDPDILSFTALAYNDLRKAVADGCATKKVVILDCCFSGRALADLAGGEETVVGQVGIEGSYILTATPANAVALAPPGARHTAFTGALLDVLRAGIPGGRELLTFAEIYPRLKYTLTSRQLPQPRQRGSDTITDLALTRNPAYIRPGHQPSTRSPAGGAITPAPLPEALAASLDNPYPAVRIGAVSILGEWLNGDDPARALTAEQRLRQIADTDIPAVATAARAYLPGHEHAVEEADRQAWVGAERQTREGAKHRASTVIRTWARQRGFKVSDDEPILAYIVEEYEAAQGGYAFAIRTWARQQGVEVSDDGPIPANIVRQYQKSAQEHFEAIRAWARQRGYKVSDAEPVPADIVQDYEAAGPSEIRIRKWARQRGYKLSDAEPVPADIVQNYEAAH
jgi:Caspase domain